MVAHGTDVLIVGAGPAGTSTAHALLQSGLTVTIVDRAHFPRAKPCAEYLSPQASRILESMGVLRAVERSDAAQLHGMRLRAPDGTTFEGRFVAGHGYRGFRDRGLALPRFDLDALLLDAARAAGARIVEEWHTRELTRDAAGRVTGAVGTDVEGHRQVLHARVVIGADGLRSSVARQLGVHRHARRPKRYALVAHFMGVRGICDHGEMHVEADGYVGLADVGRGRTNVALVVPAERMATAHQGAAAFLAQWIASHPHLADRFRAARRVTEVQSTGPFASRARRVWAPGAALVGDAAEYFDPFTGEGIYAALRGGELLAPFVASAVRALDPATSDRALAAYGRAHAEEFRGKRVIERLIGFAVSSPALFNRVARVLAGRQEMADLLVGVAGDFVPPSAVLRPRFLFDLLRTAPR